MVGELVAQHKPYKGEGEVVSRDGERGHEVTINIVVTHIHTIQRERVINNTSWKADRNKVDTTKESTRQNKDYA